jgi:hypothetical protein
LSLQDNLDNHNKAAAMLKNERVPYQIVEGVWKGEKELTFLLASTDAETHEDNLTIARSLGLLFKQDSILEVHNDDTAILRIIKGTYIEKLGTFTEVSEEVGKRVDCSTFDPASNRWFVITK